MIFENKTLNMLSWKYMYLQNYEVKSSQLHLSYMALRRHRITNWK